MLPQFRRRGVASALCEVVETKARELHLQALYLFTLDQTSFYARMGWRVFERAAWRGHEADIMIKRLEAG